MSEEKDFVGFARDLQELRYTLRSALGLSAQRPLERFRSNLRVFGERGRPQEQPQQNLGHAEQRTRILPRPFGFLNALQGQQQPQQPEEPLTPEEEERLRQYEEELHRKREEETRKEEVSKVRSQSDFSPIL